MLLPGQTLLVVEMTPALFAAVAANAAERVAPELTLVTVSMIGAAGRVYLAGSTPDIVLARDEITRVLEGVAGARPDEHRRAGRGGARRFGLSPEATAELCNVSENHTYRVEDPEARHRSRCASTAPATAPPHRSSPSSSGSTPCARTARSTPACRSPRRVASASWSTLGDAQRRAVRVAPRRRAGPRGRRGHRGIPHARRGVGPHARARARVAAARRLRPPGLGLRAHARRRRATGAGGRTGSAWAPRSWRCSTGSTRRSRPARGLRAGRPSASASSTPTSGSPTCSSTTATCA